jgi:hypothetical protein
MIDHLTDTNVFSEIFKGNADVKKFVEGFENSIDSTVYVECLQGSKGNREKLIIKKYLSHFPIFYHIPSISKQTIALIDQYSIFTLIASLRRSDRGCLSRIRFDFDNLQCRRFQIY